MWSVVVRCRRRSWRFYGLLLLSRSVDPEDGERPWPVNLFVTHLVPRLPTVSSVIVPTKNSKFLKSLYSSRKIMFPRLATRTTTTLASRCQNQRYVLNLSRGFAAQFDRSKPHVNIGTIGHVDHGKVCLVTSVIM